MPALVPVRDMRQTEKSSRSPIPQVARSLGLRVVQDRSLLWDDARQERDLRSWLGGRRATPSHRAEFSCMADDYAQYALSQRAAFQATHPAVLAAARLLADEPVLHVADLGAPDGVYSHGLSRALAH